MKELQIRTIDMKRFWDEVEVLKTIYNDAWSTNWGFVPMTDAEFRHMAKDLKTIVDPRVVLIAEKNGEPVAFSLALPDFNQALAKINGRLLPFGLAQADLLWAPHTAGPRAGSGDRKKSAELERSRRRALLRIFPPRREPRDIAVASFPGRWRTTI